MHICIHHSEALQFVMLLGVLAVVACSAHLPASTSPRHPRVPQPATGSAQPPPCSQAEVMRRPAAARPAGATPRHGFKVQALRMYRLCLEAFDVLRAVGSCVYSCRTAGGAA